MLTDSGERSRILAGLRELCLALPETSERLSHGAPTFFVRGKRPFVMVLTDHHGDGRFAIWCAAPAGIQGMLVGADPGKFFVPPYVGHRGWLGVRLDVGLDWEELAGIVEDAYAEVAAPKLVEAAGVRFRSRELPGGENVKGSDKPKKLQKKVAQKSLKEKRSEKRAAKKNA